VAPFAFSGTNKPSSSDKHDCQELTQTLKAHDVDVFCKGMSDEGMSLSTRKTAHGKFKK
jgi:hypothetical protein